MEQICLLYLLYICSAIGWVANDGALSTDESRKWKLNELTD